MGISIGPVSISPGIAQKIPLYNIPDIQAIKLSNPSQFDLTISGFGTPGSEVISAGMEYMLLAKDGNQGVIDILPVNNLGASGTGYVNMVAYSKSESLPPGTWPVSIPAQNVQAKVSTVQTLSNENGTTGTLVIDMGPATPGQVVSIWNDHFTWSVVQSGVAHQVLKGQVSGNPLQIGQSGDTSEVLGALLVDQALQTNGDLVVNVDLRFIDNGSNKRAFATNDSATNDFVIFNNPNHGLSHWRKSDGATDIFTVSDSSGITLVNGALNLLAGSLQRVWMSGQVSVASTGTSVAHGLGVVPTIVVGILDVGSAPNAAFGINYGTMTSTHFTAFVESGTVFMRFIAFA